MKKLSWLVVLAMLASMVFAFSAPAETAVTYTQSPMLDAAVANGTLPAVQDRLPDNPKITEEILPEYLTYTCGNYGGTLRLVTKVVNWDADGFVGNNEAFLTMESTASDVIKPNVMENCVANDDNTVFTFTMRKGLKWSDGQPVTMDDIEYTINNFVFNKDLTPVIAGWMRDGGRNDGQPFTFTKIDDWTFTLAFNESYGGFPVHLSIAGWKGYTELLQPAHILKQFNLACAEEVHGSVDAFYAFIAPFAKSMGYDDPKADMVWVNVYNQVNMTNWELTNPNAALTSKFFGGLVDWNFPVLYPWVMVSSDNGVTTWDRNPYYFKVDANGQQLPYIDHLTSTLVENMEMVQMKYMGGGADFGRESATIDNISLYRENEATAGITAYVTSMHNNPTDVSLNINYGLNPDGTVKSDDASKAWQEVINDLRFRQALMHAIDANEIIDAVYHGFAQVNPSYQCDFDQDTANALLDDMGMKDINGDGYRETPSGLPFSFQIWNAQEANDIVPVTELCVEFWKDVGIKAEGYTTESTLLATSQVANEIPCRIAWVHSTQLWHYQDWFIASWAPLWNAWVAAGGLSGKLATDATYLEPPQEFKDFRLAVDSLMTVDPVTAVNTVLPQLNDWMSQHLYLIEPLINVQQCVIINSDIGNVPTGGVGISWNFSMEQFYYNHPDQH